MNEKLIGHISVGIVWSPLIITYLLYKIHLLIKKQKWQAIHFTTEFSTVFYIVATTILLKQLFNQSVIGYILIFLILTLAIILIVQWKNHTEVILTKGLKTLFRLSFLIFFVSYLLVGGYRLITIFILN